MMREAFGVGQYTRGIYDRTQEVEVLLRRTVYIQEQTKGIIRKALTEDAIVANVQPVYSYDRNTGRQTILQRVSR